MRSGVLGRRDRRGMPGAPDPLNMKKGDRDFTIEVVIMPAPSANTLDAAKIELAKLVLSRL